jgi:hypothetical protein
MSNHDGMIRREDIKAIRRRIGDDGWGDTALSIFEREPVLGMCIADHWTRIRLLLIATGVSDEQARPALRQIIRMVVESIELQKRSQDKLLADFLPDLEGGGHA